MAVSTAELDLYRVRADVDSSHNSAIQAAIEQSIQPYIAAAARMGGNPDDIREGMRLVNPDPVYSGEIWTPDGWSPFTSSRICIGYPGNPGQFRGGLEYSPYATPAKVACKAVTMRAKHALAWTGNDGGKGGIMIAPEYLGLVSDEVRWRLFGAYALMHDINAWTNPTATDLYTGQHEMNAIVAARRRRDGRYAVAAAAGASEEYGGIPSFTGTCTGEGSAMTLASYLRVRAANGDDLVQGALDGTGRKLLLLQQAVGKAGAPFIEHLPQGTQLAGLMEHGGAIYSFGDALKPKEVMNRVRSSSGLGIDTLQAGERWISKEHLGLFWQQFADIGVPAFDRDQVTADDIRHSRIFAWACVANNPLTSEAMQAADDNHVDVLVGELLNRYGTLSSSLFGRMVLESAFHSPADLRAAGDRIMQEQSDQFFTELYEERRRRGAFVSIADLAAEKVARNVIARVHGEATTDYLVSC